MEAKLKAADTVSTRHGPRERILAVPYLIRPDEHTLTNAVPTVAHSPSQARGSPAASELGSRDLAPHMQLMRLPSELVHQPPKPTPHLYDLTREQAPPDDVQRLVFKQV